MDLPSPSLFPPKEPEEAPSPVGASSSALVAVRVMTPETRCLLMALSGRVASVAPKSANDPKRTLRERPNGRERVAAGLQ